MGKARVDRRERSTSWIRPPKAKRIALEFIYKHTLLAFSRMDFVGHALRDDFPEWERSPYGMDLRNKTKHRRLLLSANRAVFEVFAPSDVQGELTRGKAGLTKTCEQFEVGTLQKATFKGSFAAQPDRDFHQLADHLCRRLFQPLESVPAFRGSHMVDLAYVVDLDLSDQWSCNIRVGPMTRKEWPETVKNQPQLFSAGNDSLDSFMATIPAQFVFIEIDVYQKSVPLEKALSYVPNATRVLASMSSELIDHLGADIQ